MIAAAARHDGLQATLCECHALITTENYCHATNTCERFGLVALELEALDLSTPYKNSFLLLMPLTFVLVQVSHPQDPYTAQLHVLD